MKEKLFGMNAFLQNNPETNQTQEPEMTERQENDQIQGFQMQETNGDHPEAQSLQNVDMNDLNKLILLLQTHNILSNKAQDQGSSDCPNLNELIAHNLQDQIKENAQRIFHNPDLATPEE
jgi:hypothetical protein